MAARGPSVALAPQVSLTHVVAGALRDNRLVVITTQEAKTRNLIQFKNIGHKAPWFACRVGRKTLKGMQTHTKETRPW